MTGKADQWLLSTGKNVDEIMLQVALERTHEHLAHSMIMDPLDCVWNDHFTIDERQEMLAFAAKPLPTFPTTLQHHLNSYDAFMTTPSDLYFEAAKKTFHPMDDRDDEWIQQSMMFYAKMFMADNQVDIRGVSEADLLLKLWRPLYDVFNETNISVTTGETTSTSSAHRLNLGRTLDDRKKMGPRLDLIFKCGEQENGAAEIGRNTLGVSDSKFMLDGGLKLPKSLKDMISLMVDQCPEKRNELRTIGLVIMGSNIQLISVDIPFGNVCRLTKTTLFKFPLTYDKFKHDIQPIIKLIWKSYQAIKVNTALITHSNPSLDVDTLKIIPTLPLPPSYTPAKSTRKKRKIIEE
ncbi:unnamed protein product [Absidia cylindrospora]